MEFRLWRTPPRWCIRTKLLNDIAMSTTRFRTDTHRNPAAFTVDIAKQAHLVEGVDYTAGESFSTDDGHTYSTASLLGNPIELTIRVIDRVGFYTKAGGQRWDYIGIPKEIWDVLTYSQKTFVVGFMYRREGGTEMAGLFRPLPTPTTPSSGPTTA